MKRRDFLQQSAIAGAATGLSFPAFGTKPVPTAPKPFNLNYAFHQGMFAQHAGNNFIDQIQFAYEMGFRAIEDNGFMDRPIDEQKKIGHQLDKLGMKMGVFVLNFDRWPVSTSLTLGNKEWNNKLLAAAKNAIECAKRCQATWITVVPGNYARNLDMGLQTANVIEALRPACDLLAPHGLIMVLEALSDTPELFLRYSGQTYAICKALNHPSCKFLADMYHLQRNEGNIIANIDAYWDEIAYLQIGDNPGRLEPTTGEMNYKNIFKHLYQKGYKGVLGMEHGLSKPGKDGEMALIKSYQESDDFL